MPVERWRRAAVAGSLLLLVAGAARAEPAAETLALCTACHGPGGNATFPLTPSIAGQPKVFIENQLVLVREGLRDIPVMKDAMARLTDEQIVDLARYFAAQPFMPRPLAVQPERQRLGAELARKALCGTCHLSTFVGQQQVPRLAGQDEAYLMQAMRQFRDHAGPGRDTIMSASLYGLTDADLANLAHYLASYRVTP
jgi:cytochrome c553